MKALGAPALPSINDIDSSYSRLHNIYMFTPKFVCCSTVVFVTLCEYVNKQGRMGRHCFFISVIRHTKDSILTSTSFTRPKTSRDLAIRHGNVTA